MNSSIVTPGLAHTSYPLAASLAAEAAAGLQSAVRQVSRINER
jgi:hypothetical protein